MFDTIFVPKVFLSNIPQFINLDLSLEEAEKQMADLLKMNNAHLSTDLSRYQKNSPGLSI